jgi:hypothetical protein
MEPITKFFEALDTGNADAIAACLDPAFSFANDATGTTWDAATFCQRIEAVHAAVDAPEIVLGESLAVGNTVVVNVALTGTPAIPLDAAILGPALPEGGSAPLALAPQPWTFEVSGGFVASCRAGQIAGASFADVLATVPEANLLA